MRDPLLDPTHGHGSYPADPRTRLPYLVAVIAVAIGAIGLWVDTPGVAPLAPTLRAPNTTVVLRFDPTPAPAAVQQLVLRFGGGRASSWVRDECAWLLPLLAEHGLPEWMGTVAWRESRCRPTAHNDNPRTRDDSWGLFQINALGPLLRTELRRTCGIDEPAVLLDAETSVRCAAELFRRYGYRPWNAGVYFG